MADERQKIPRDQLPDIGAAQDMTQVFAGRPMGDDALTPPAPVVTPPLAPPVVVNPDVTAPTDVTAPAGTVPAAQPKPDAAATPAGPNVVTLNDNKSTFATYDPTKDKEAKAAADAHLKAITSEKELEAAQNTMASADATLKAQQMAKDIEAENLRRADEERVLQEKQADVQKQMDAYKDMKIDPSRMWGNLGTGDKLLAGLSLALGAFGAGAQGPGGQNLAMGVIDKAIERDIDAQKANMDKAGRAVQMSHTLYQDMRQKFGDDRVARAAMREMAYSQLATEAEARMQAAKSEITKANGATIVAELKAKEAEAANERAKVVHENMKKQEIAPAKGGIQLGSRLLQKDERDPLDAGENTIKALSKLDKAIDEVKDQDIGRLDNFVNDMKQKFNLDVDPAWVKAAQSGNLVAKAYLKEISGSGVTDKELERTLKDILPSLSMSKDVAHARIRNMADTEYAKWGTSAKNTVDNFLHPDERKMAQQEMLRRNPAQYMYWNTPSYDARSKQPKK